MSTYRVHHKNKISALRAATTNYQIRIFPRARATTKMLVVAQLKKMLLINYLGECLYMYDNAYYQVCIWILRCHEVIQITNFCIVVLNPFFLDQN